MLIILLIQEKFLYHEEKRQTTDFGERSNPGRAYGPEG
jgi:hypothetical protein